MRLRQALGTVEHGKDPKAKRPRGVNVVLWIGSVKPEQAKGVDMWLDTKAS
jgi:hypothetical protein